jgi:tetratricopeptide (TPR) repeat protein
MLFAKDHTRKIAITGLGGVGKTQVALELIFRTRKKHKDCIVIWIPVTSIESLHQAYRDVAKQLRVPGWEDEKADPKRLVQLHLSKESTGRWLLLFDNADDIDMWIAKAGSDAQHEAGSYPLIDYLPKNKQGTIIFTTRDRKVAVKLAQQNVVEIPEMDENTAGRLLKNCRIHHDSTDNPQDQSDLLSQLTCLPLAIVQAAAYINENGITLADYLALLAEQEEEVIDLLSEEFEDDGRYRNVKNPIATTWLISFERIRQRDSLATEYLSFMACIHPKSIPQNILPPCPSRKKETEAIGTLTAYCFVTRRPAGGYLDLHRLVHLATRNWLRKEELLTQCTYKAALRLAAVMPDDQVRNLNVWNTYLPHANHILQSGIAGVNRLPKTLLWWRLTAHLLKDGRFNEIESMVLKWLDAHQKLLGRKHPDILTVMHHMANIYTQKGQWSKAEVLQIQVMEARMRELGPEHPDTLSEMSNLAITYRNAGQWDKAEELQLKVLETRQKVHRPEHPQLLTSIAALASIYSYKGQWEKAENLQVQVLDIQKQVLGPEHPDTLTTMDNLAMTYSQKSQWDQAENLRIQALNFRKEALGPNHLDTLNSMGDLAMIYRNKGQLDAAEDLQVQALQIHRTLFPSDDIFRITAMANLFGIYHDKRQWDKAEELGVQIIGMSKKVFGPGHPETLKHTSALAATYESKGQLEQAEALQIQVMEIGRKELGPEHPHTIIYMHNLAIAWKIRRQDAKALSLMMECVKIAHRVLGPNHPSYMNLLGTLALCMAPLGTVSPAGARCD